MDTFLTKWQLISMSEVEKLDDEIMDAADKIQQYKRKRDYYGLTDEDITEVKKLKEILEKNLLRKRYLGW